MGFAHTITLNVVDADVLEDFYGFLIFYEFSHDTFFHEVAYFTNGFDNGIVTGILIDITDKRTIDLQKIDWQTLQISIGRHPGAEIIQ